MQNDRVTFVGWLVFLLLLYFWSKSKIGYEVIYYALALILLFMVMVNYQAIDKTLLVKAST